MSHIEGVSIGSCLNAWIKWNQCGLWERYMKDYVVLIEQTHLIIRHGYYWSMIMVDCYRYAKVWSFTKDSNRKHAWVVKPSPFRGWAMDVVSKIYQPHLKDNFILVPIDYFMKWVEAEPLVSVTQKLWLGSQTQYDLQFWPQLITTDQGTMFTRDKVSSFIWQFNIKLISSTPYYAQANGQTKATNKILIDIVKKNLEENPKRWHETLQKELCLAEILQPKQLILPHFGWLMDMM